MSPTTAATSAAATRIRIRAAIPIAATAREARANVSQSSFQPPDPLDDPSDACPGAGVSPAPGSVVLATAGTASGSKDGLAKGSNEATAFGSTEPLGMGPEPAAACCCPCGAPGAQTDTDPPVAVTVNAAP